MTVGNYNLNNIWLQLAKYEDVIRKLIVAVLALYILAFVAQLSWRMMPAPDQSEQSISTTSRPAQTIPTNNGITGSDIDKVKKLNLFGDAAEKPKQETVEVTDAPETSLNLTLSGVVASTEKNVAAAIIENRGQQATYGINDKIEGTNAFLVAVYADRVIIRNGSRQETLMMDGIDYNTSADNSRPEPEPRRTRVTPTRPNRITGDAADVTRNLRRSPTSFADYIAISPHRVDNELQGYRIRPGKNPQLFKAAGFRSGDVVTEINGLDLADPRQSIEAMKALRTSKSLQLTVNRGGETLSLSLEFPPDDSEDEAF